MLPSATRSSPTPASADTSSSASSAQRADVRRFLRHLIIFSIPFWLYSLFILSTDPFNYFGISHVIPDELKLDTAARLDPCFWKMNQFNARPVPNILLGDSRMVALRSETIKQITGLDYFNFAYGGGTLQEAVDTFWFAQNRLPLKSVYIGVNLNVYNDYNDRRRTQLLTAVRRNPALYFMNRTVLQSAAYALYSWLSHTDLKIGIPRLDREAFWQDQLGAVTAGYYSPYARPTRYIEDLWKISDFAKANRIELTFVIFPTHVDLQNRIHDFHLENQNASLRKDLGMMAPTYDFDYPNSLTIPRDNFLDPYHVTSSIDTILIRELWMGPRQFAHVYAPGLAVQ